MKSYNHVILIGHLAADPELRETKKGHSVANFAIAVNRNTVGDDGEKQEVADFYRIVAWRRLSEICDKYLKKGMPVLVQGRLINNNFEDKKGNKHYRTEVVLEDLRILSPRNSNNGEAQVSVETVPGVNEEELVAH